MPYQLDGVTLKPGRPFETNDGTQYPGDWLDQSTPVERAELGIQWVEPAVQPYYDQRFYWGPNNPKDLDGLKYLWVSKQKEIAGTFLSPSDWYIVRMTEHPECLCPSDVRTYRNDVRSVSGIREGQINACADVEELEALIKAPAAIEVVTQEYVPADGETPEVPEVSETQPNPAALEAWPDVVSD